MKKNLLLYILLVFLIVVNGFFLFNYLGRPGARGSGGPDDFIAKQLKFNQSQMDQFKIISDSHREKMKNISDEIRKQKDVLFNKISEPNINKKEIDSIISIISIKEGEIETEVFYNLRSIQELCNDNQKERFSNIVKNARHGGGNPKQMPPPPKK